MLDRIGLFPLDDDPNRWSPQYDYDANGRRFVVVKTMPYESIRLSVMLNWFADLERLVPTGRWALW